MLAWTEANFWRHAIRLNLGIARFRSRNDRCKFSTRLLALRREAPKPRDVVPSGINDRFRDHRNRSASTEMGAKLPVGFH